VSPRAVFFDQMVRTKGAVDITEAAAPSARGSIEPVMAVSHAPKNVQISPQA